MLDEYCNKFIKKAQENYKLYEFLNEHNKFIGWQVVAVFYSALCYAKAYLYKKGISINSINSHNAIKFYLGTETTAKNAKILTSYETLYRNSRDARYREKPINKKRLEYVLENYGKFKDFFDTNYNKL